MKLERLRNNNKLHFAQVITKILAFEENCIYS